MPFNTEKLDSNWLPVLTGSGRFDIAVEKEQDWKTLHKLPYAQKLFTDTAVTGKGQVLQLSAAKGKLGIAAAMGQFPIRLINMPARTLEGPLARLLIKHNIHIHGFHRKERDNRATISPFDLDLTAAMMIA